MKEEKPSYEFGNFQLNVEEKQLRRLTGELIPLPPKAFELLAFLVKNNQRLLTKAEIMDKVWADSFVEEGNLKINIHALRKILDLNGDSLIETVPRHGYRFTGKVKRIEPPLESKFTDQQIAFPTTIDVDSARSITPELESGFKRQKFWLPGISVLLLGLLAFGFYSLSRPEKNQSSQRANTIFKPTKTIAVLPFINLTKKSQDEFLGVGLADSLITKLGSISRISVRPTSSVLQFTEKTTPQTVSEKLQVENILEGTIQRIGKRLKISVQLVQMPDNQVLWANGFEENESDLLKIQDSISAQIVKSLEINLNQEERNLFARNETSSYEAYQLYLKGRYAWNKRTAASLQESVKLFQASIDNDPTFTLAYTGLADSYALLSEYFVALPRETFPRAKAAAQKALEIDPKSAEAHTTLAYSLASYDWNFAEAELEYRKAIELNPNYPTAAQWYGELLVGLKRFDEADAQLKKARELDPLSPIIQTDIGLLLSYKLDFEAAIRQFQQTVNDNPNFPFARYGLALAYEKQGKFDEAFAEELEAWRLSGGDQKTIGFLGQAYRNGGREGFLRGQLVIYDEIEKTRYNPAFSKAFLYGRLGDFDNAIRYLEKSYDERFRYTLYVKIEPIFATMHDDPRFQDLLRRLDIPQN